MKDTANYVKNKTNPFIPLSPESKYWLGYIFADGHIIYSKRHYSVSLFSINQDIMNKFRNFIGNKAHMYVRPTGIIQVCYNSKPTTEWFVNTLGIPVRKALTLNPNIPIDWDILHGYFDGDGSIRADKSRGKYNRYEMKFTTGSKIWKNRIVKFLSNNGIITHVNTKGNAYDINISGKVQLKYMWENLYKSNTSRLEYKYQTFVALFSDEQDK